LPQGGCGDASFRQQPDPGLVAPVSSSFLKCLRSEFREIGLSCAKIANFMVSTIFGTKPPDGVTPIRDERVRGRLGELFLKARLVGGRRGRRAARVGNSRELWEAECKAHEDAERDLDAKLARLRRIEAGETGGSSAG
jgi:hypothetical protein